MNQINLLLKEGFDSKHLFEKINILGENSTNSFSKGLNWIVENKINLVLVGGTAVVHYLNKGRDLTPDIDFLVSDIEDVKTKLNHSNISYSNLIDNSGNIIGITVDEFNVDFLKTINKNKTISNLVLKSYLKANIGGVSLKIINPELLAISKLDLGREKDLNDGFFLLKSGYLNKEKYLVLANGLKTILSDPDAIISYAEIIK